MTIKSKMILLSVSLAAAITMLLSLCSVAAADAQNEIAFSDISGHWAEAQIKEAVSAGFVTGYTDGTFKPNATITGAEFLSMMVKALQYPVETAAVDESWFAPFQKAATSRGLYKDDYSSGLDKPITRSEISSTIVRATHNALFETMIKEEMQRAFPADAFINDPVRKAIEAGPDFTGDFDFIYEHPEQVIADLQQALASVKKRIPPQLITDAEECKKNEKMCGYFISVDQSDIEDLMKRLQKSLDPLLKLKTDQIISQNRMIYEAASRGLLTGTTPGELSLHSKVTRAQAVTFINRVVAFNSGERYQTNKYTVAAAEVAWHKTNMMTVVPRYFSAYTGNEFDDQGWSSTSINKLASCTTKSFIAIDLDDPNDPNRKWLTDDLKWGEYPNFYSLKGVNGYALLSISEINYKQQPASYHNSCSIVLDNQDWYDIRNSPDTIIDAKQPQTQYVIGVVDKEGVRLKPKEIAGSPAIQVSGYIIPKSFSSKKPFNLYYQPIDNVTGGTPLKPIYHSYMNDKFE